MKSEQEPKYDCNEFGRIYNRHSKHVIPDDEPVFIFRARDIHAREVLEAYARVIDPGDHRDAVCQRIEDFARFAAGHPERMKAPDTSAPRRRQEADDRQGGIASRSKA